MPSRNRMNRSRNRRSRRSRSRNRRNRRSRSRNRRRGAFKHFMITIPHPERRYSDLQIQIPSPSRCMSPYVRSTNYCGTKRRIPSGYTRRGTTFECLRKGFGAGVCSIYKQNN